VRDDNPAALRAYLRHGFAEVGRARRHAKVRGVYLDEVLIERFL
jgi:RimJ/RimL family protein N-acetyltransferase